MRADKLRALRLRRGERTRASLRRGRGEEKPRLSVYRSGKHTYVQVVAKGETLVQASTLSGDLKGVKGVGGAKEVGLAAGRAATEAGMKKVVFDRGRYVYHGRVRAVAEGAREAGLEF